MITSSIHHCSAVRQKEFSRRVEMSKVESFYWNKLSNKSFSFESEKSLVCVLFQLFRGVALITSSIHHCCAVRQAEMSKVESFYWYRLSSKSFSFESEQFLIFLLFQLFRGVAGIT